MKVIAGVVILAMLAGCATKEDREKWATVAAVVAIGALAYSAAKHGGAGGATPTTDYDWDWDEFYSQGRLVWACRGVQTGQFADASHCTYKLKTDARWPGQ